MKSTQVIIETSHPFHLLLEVDQTIWKPFRMIGSTDSSAIATPLTVNIPSPAPFAPHSSSLMYWSLMALCSSCPAVSRMSRRQVTPSITTCFLYWLSLARWYYSENRSRSSRTGGVMMSGWVITQSRNLSRSTRLKGDRDKINWSLAAVNTSADIRQNNNTLFKVNFLFHIYLNYCFLQDSVWQCASSTFWEKF